MEQTLALLKQQRDDINRQFLTKMYKDNVHMKILADNMAEAATNIQGQGYAAFVNARETFLNEMDRISDEYSVFMCDESCTPKSYPK